jgi:hypothetical protein
MKSRSLIPDSIGTVYPGMLVVCFDGGTVPHRPKVAIVSLLPPRAVVGAIQRPGLAKYQNK